MYHSLADLTCNHVPSLTPLVSTPLISTIHALLTQFDPVDAMLAGVDVDPPDRGSSGNTSASATTSTCIAHRTVSLLPMVRAAMEGLLFVHAAPTGSTGLGIATAASSSSSSGSHVNAMQGQGQRHVYHSPLHIWLALWRRSSSSCYPLTRLISNMLITLLHEQRRQPCSSAITLHVPHIGTPSPNLTLTLTLF